MTVDLRKDYSVQILVVIVAAIVIYVAWNGWVDRQIDRCYQMAEGSRAAQLAYGYEASMDWVKLRECLERVPGSPLSR